MKLALQLRWKPVSITRVVFNDARILVLPLVPVHVEHGVEIGAGDRKPG